MESSYRERSLLDLKSQYANIKQDIQVVLEKICAEQSLFLALMFRP